MPTSLVIGGGLIGLSTAYFLQQAGDRVIIIERNEAVGRGASYANGGYICPSDVAPWAGPGALSSFVRRQISSSFGGRSEEERLRRVAERVSMLLGGKATGDSGVAAPHRWQWRWRFFRASVAGQSNYTERTKILFRLASKSRDLVLMLAEKHRFHERLGLKRGTITLYDTERGFAAAREHAVWLRREVGVDIDVLADRFAIRAHDPFFGQEEVGGLQAVGAVYSRENWVGDAHGFCEQMQSQLQQVNTGFRLGTTVHSVTAETTAEGQLRIVNVKTDKGETIAVDRVVVCAGVHTPLVVEEHFAATKTPILIQPVKGHSITLSFNSLKPPAGWPALRTGFVHGETHSYVSKLPQDTYRMTNGVDFYGFDSAVDPDKIGWLQQLASTVGFPQEQVAAAAASAWVGLRPSTPTGIPYIGRLPGYENAFVNAGHGSLGWTLAAASGRLCADIINDYPEPIVDPAPFRVDSVFH